MKVNKLKKEELEVMSYNDIANLLLNEESKQNTAVLFKKIVDLLELSTSTYESKIGDFYTSMSNDKRFIMLDDGTWDLRKNHKSSVMTMMILMNFMMIMNLRLKKTIMMIMIKMMIFLMLLKNTRILLLLMKKI